MTTMTGAVALAVLCGGASASQLIGTDPVKSCLWPGASTLTTAACFAPGTSGEYMEAFWNEFLLRQGIDPLADFNVTSRWNGNSLQGTPITVTYSFPADGLGGIGGGQTSVNVLNSMMATWFGSVQNGKNLFRLMFDRWEALSGARYLEVNDDNAAWGAGGGTTRGDIRIVSITIDGGGNTLAFNSFPNNGDMVIDSSENYSSSGNNFRFFRNVVAHENGHGMGILHVCPQNGSKLMEPAANTNFDGPQHDDTRAMQRHYGDTLENNNNAAEATVIPTLTLGTPFIQRDVSIDNQVANANLDIDWYRFTLPSAAELNVQLQPVGFQYQSTSQSGQSCPTGSNIDSKAILNLRFEILASDGVTVLASVDNETFGVNENLTAFPMPAGVFYLMVRAGDTAQGSLPPQMYQFLVNAIAVQTPCPGDANGDGVVNFSDLNIVLGQFGQTGPGLAGDLDGNGSVNFTDLNLVLSNFGITC
ncbi:MAG: matrixin family metalloprotease [Phycisphaerales bacterium]